MVYQIVSNLLNLLCDFLRNRKQIVLLNGQASDWFDVRSGVPQGSILRPLLFLIYIKLFVDDISLFSVIHDSNASALELNSDLAKITRWTFQPRS